MKKKSTFLLLLLLILIGGGAAGFYYYNYVTNPVSVYPVTLLKSDWENHSDGNVGTVGNYMTQNVIPPSGTGIEKIFVEPNQQVKAGDKILEYNVEAKKIDLELKEYDVKQLELSIDKANEQLRYLWGLEDSIKAGRNGDGYSLSEVWKMEEELKEEMKSIRLDLKEAQLDYDALKKEVEDAVMTAAMDGYVKEINPAPEEGEAAVLIVSDEQLSIRGTVDEFYYQQIKVGMMVTAVSWETGKTVKAVITELSSYPVTLSGGSSSGNPNVSYYPFKAVIDESYTEITAGESVSMSFDQNNVTEGAGSIYLPNAYVRTDGDAPYVYIRGKGGTLKKQNVQTGQAFYNMVIEVKSGIGYEDYIAFPYGPMVKEGAKTVISEDESEIVY